tara:strand:- start:121 stop:417 length:297 start_codon:yes stop_codon:yes gene_type:complete
MQVLFEEVVYFHQDFPIPLVEKLHLSFQYQGDQVLQLQRQHYHDHFGFRHHHPIHQDDRYSWVMYVVVLIHHHRHHRQQNIEHHQLLWMNYHQDHLDH